jgi:hypothetical protein
MSATAWQALTWEIARVGGFVAYGLVLSSVVLGLVLSLGWRSARYPRFVTTELHRFVTLLGVVFIAVHSIAVFVDPFIRFTPAEVLVPLLSHYRPIWVAMGITAGYLALAVYLSERVRFRIGYAAWRRLHYLAFLVFVLATLHGLATGSDTRTPWAIAIYGGGVIVVGALLAARLGPVVGRSPQRALLVLPSPEPSSWPPCGRSEDPAPGWSTPPAASRAPLPAEPQASRQMTPRRRTRSSARSRCRSRHRSPARPGEAGVRTGSSRSTLGSADRGREPRGNDPAVGRAAAAPLTLTVDRPARHAQGR